MSFEAPTTLPEMFCEVNKAIVPMINFGHRPSIKKTSYILQISAELYFTINSGSLYIVIDLETYAASQKKYFFAGYNSKTLNISFVLLFCCIRSCNHCTI